MKQQLDENSKRITQICGKEISVYFMGAEITIPNYMNAVFGVIGNTYLSLAIVFLIMAPILGKVMFPQLAKMYTAANVQMADLAAIQTNEIIKGKQKNKEWF